MSVRVNANQNVQEVVCQLQTLVVGLTYSGKLLLPLRKESVISLTNNMHVIKKGKGKAKS
jgi:hypothetical protein